MVFIVFLLLFQTSKAIDAGHELDYNTSMGEWKRRDIQYCRFTGYDLTYAHYSKFPSWGLQDLISTEINNISYRHQYPFPFYKYLSDVNFQELQKLLIENTTREYVNIITKTFYCAQLLLNYINEYSPLVLFSWWRNKISWNVCISQIFNNPM